MSLFFNAATVRSDQRSTSASALSAPRPVGRSLALVRYGLMGMLFFLAQAHSRPLGAADVDAAEPGDWPSARVAALHQQALAAPGEAAAVEALLATWLRWQPLHDCLSHLATLSGSDAARPADRLLEATALASCGDPVAALQAFDAVGPAIEGHVAALLVRTACQRGLLDFDAAGRSLAIAATLDRDADQQRRLLVERGLLAAAAGIMAHASEPWRQAIALGMEPMQQEWLIETALRLDCLDVARANCRQLLAATDEATARWRRWSLLAEIETRRGDRPAALAALQQALATCPSASWHETRSLADLEEHFAASGDRAGWRAVIATLPTDTAERLAAEPAAAQLPLDRIHPAAAGSAVTAGQDWDRDAILDARQRCQQRCTETPTDADAWLALAAVQEQDRASASLRAGLRATDGDVRLWLALARRCQAAERRVIDQIVRKKDVDVQARFAVIAADLRQRHEPHTIDRMIVYWRHRHQRDPADLVPLLALAQIQSQLQQYLAQAVHVDALRRRQAEHPAVVLAVARLADDRRQDQRAIAGLRRSLRRSEDWACRVQLADLLFDQHDDEAGRQQVDAALAACQAPWQAETLAQLLGHHERWHDAAELLREAGRRYPAALGLRYRQALACYHMQEHAATRRILVALIEALQAFPTKIGAAGPGPDFQAQQRRWWLARQRGGRQPIQKTGDFHRAIVLPDTAAGLLEHSFILLMQAAADLSEEEFSACADELANAGIAAAEWQIIDPERARRRWSPESQEPLPWLARLRDRDRPPMPIDDLAVAVERFAASHPQLALMTLLQAPTLAQFDQHFATIGKRITTAGEPLRRALAGALNDLPTDDRQRSRLLISAARRWSPQLLEYRSLLQALTRILLRQERVEELIDLLVACQHGGPFRPPDWTPTHLAPLFLGTDRTIQTCLERITPATPGFDRLIAAVDQVADPGYRLFLLECLTVDEADIDQVAVRLADDHADDAALLELAAQRLASGKMVDHHRAIALLAQARRHARLALRRRRLDRAIIDSAAQLGPLDAAERSVVGNAAERLWQSSFRPSQRLALAATQEQCGATALAAHWQELACTLPEHPDRFPGLRWDPDGLQRRFEQLIRLGRDSQAVALAADRLLALVRYGMNSRSDAEAGDIGYFSSLQASLERAGLIAATLEACRRQVGETLVGLAAESLRQHDAAKTAYVAALERDPDDRLARLRLVALVAAEDPARGAALLDAVAPPAAEAALAALMKASGRMRRAEVSTLFDFCELVLVQWHRTPTQRRRSMPTNPLTRLLQVVATSKESTDGLSPDLLAPQTADATSIDRTLQQEHRRIHRALALAFASHPGADTEALRQLLLRSRREGWRSDPVLQESIDAYLMRTDGGRRDEDAALVITEILQDWWRQDRSRIGNHLRQGMIAAGNERLAALLDALLALSEVSTDRLTDAASDIDQRLTDGAAPVHPGAVFRLIWRQLPGDHPDQGRWLRRHLAAHGYDLSSFLDDDFADRLSQLVDRQGQGALRRLLTHLQEDRFGSGAAIVRHRPSGSPAQPSRMQRRDARLRSYRRLLHQGRDRPALHLAIIEQLQGLGVADDTMLRAFKEQLKEAGSGGAIMAWLDGSTLLADAVDFDPLPARAATEPSAFGILVTRLRRWSGDDRQTFLDQLTTRPASLGSDLLHNLLVAGDGKEAAAVWSVFGGRIDELQQVLDGDPGERLARFWCSIAEGYRPASLTPAEEAFLDRLEQRHRQGALQTIDALSAADQVSDIGWLTEHRAVERLITLFQDARLSINASFALWQHLEGLLPTPPAPTWRPVPVVSWRRDGRDDRRRDWAAAFLRHDEPDRAIGLYLAAQSDPHFAFVTDPRFQASLTQALRQLYERSRQRTSDGQRHWIATLSSLLPTGDDAPGAVDELLPALCALSFTSSTVPLPSLRRLVEGYADTPAAAVARMWLGVQELRRLGSDPDGRAAAAQHPLFDQVHADDGPLRPAGLATVAFLLGDERGDHLVSDHLLRQALATLVTADRNRRAAWRELLAAALRRFVRQPAEADWQHCAEQVLDLLSQAVDDQINAGHFARRNHRAPQPLIWRPSGLVPFELAARCQRVDLCRRLLGDGWRLPGSVDIPVILLRHGMMDLAEDWLRLHPDEVLDGTPTARIDDRVANALPELIDRLADRPGLATIAAIAIAGRPSGPDCTTTAHTRLARFANALDTIADLDNASRRRLAEILATAGHPPER